jgi:hypothetical protein
MARSAPLKALVALGFWLVGSSALGAEFFAAPGRASAIAPVVQPILPGAPIRVGFQTPINSTAPPPSAFRVFIEPDDGEEQSDAACLARLRRHIAAAGRVPGQRELGGVVIAAFGEDKTITIVDPAIRGIAGLVPLPGRVDSFVADPLGQRLFVATNANDALLLIDLGNRRLERALNLPAPALALAWDPILEALFVVTRDGMLMRLDPESLEVRGRVALREPPKAMALLVPERLLAIATERELLFLEPASLSGRGALPEAAQSLAVSGRIVFAANDTRVHAIDAPTRRVVARYTLPSPPRQMLGHGSGEVLILGTDGGAVQLDAAHGKGAPVATPEAALAEAALVGAQFFLRSAASPRLMSLPAGAGIARQSLPAFLEAGTHAFGEAPLPLMANLPGRLLVANPGDGRIFVHTPGMTAPTAVFTAGGSPVIGLAAVARIATRTMPARVELTSVAPSIGRWRLLAAQPETGIATCKIMEVVPG